MSIRAYRELTQPVLSHDATFSLWSDDGVVDSILELSGTISTGDELDYMEVNVDELKELIDTNGFKKNCRPETLKSLLADVQASEKDNDDFIRYRCY